MDYKVNWDGGVFAVPDAAADCLKLIPSKAAKVLLYIMRFRDLPEDPSDIGENFTAEDIEEAVNCWVQAGVLYRSDAPSAAPVAITQPKAAPAAEVRKPVTVLAPKPDIKPAAQMPADKPKELPPQQKSLLPTEISERIRSSDEVSFLFRSAESSLGRVLTFDDQRTILWFYDHLGLSADVIIMLIAFCCSVGKSSMAYIEKIAIDWNSKSISNHDQAEAEILNMQRVFSFESKVQQRLRLPEKLTASQKKYISQWAENNMDIDMVELAYDKTVDATGKPAFQYMNKILQKWADNNITNVSDAEAFDERTKPSAKKAAQSKNAADNSQKQSPSFDLSAILEHARNSTPTL